LATIAAGQAHATPERFNEAYRALRADRDIQFDLHPVTPPAPTPAWLRAIVDWIGEAFKPIGRFLAWIGSFMPDAPYARIILWSVLVAAICCLLWTLWTRLREGRWRLPRWRRRVRSAATKEQVDEWQPEAAPARAWLEEADALAAEGHYADAAHHLLIRSIEDIGRRRPGLVQPALTSRDLAAAPAMPMRARQLFAGIAAVVERSLFGGRSVNADEWAGCRSAYADFVQTPTWKRA
jgi:hypothetical protein